VIDHRADIWSLGVILYECLCGERPVEGENAARIMVRLMSTGIIPLERLVPTLPRDLSALVGRMLSREPGRRPKTLSEVRSVLERLTEERAPEFGEPEVELALRPEGLPSPTDSSTPPVVPASGRALRQPGAKRWSLLLAGVAAAVGALAANEFNRQGRSSAAARTSAPPPARSAERSAPPLSSPRALPAAAFAAPTHAAASSTARFQATRSRPPTPRLRVDVAPSAPPAAASSGLPRGAVCERSRDCASRLCLAFACE
jgi:serine/threonine-protein kinase